MSEEPKECKRNGNRCRDEKCNSSFVYYTWAIKCTKCGALYEAKRSEDKEVLGRREESDWVGNH